MDPDTAQQQQQLLTWTRPQEVPPPTVWGRHEHGGVKYRVQDATPDLHERMLQLYVEEYLRDEPACGNLGVADEEVSAAEYMFLMANALAQGCSLVALEEPEVGGPEIVGGMILPVMSKDDPELPEVEGKAMRTLMGLNARLRAATPFCDPLSRPAGGAQGSEEGPLGGWGGPVPHYACDLGLLVRRDRRGRGIGQAVLGAVPAICRGLGVPHCSTLFTGAASQAMARKAGFKELTSLDYADIRDEAGSPVFRNMTEKTVRLMGIDISKEDK